MADEILSADKARALFRYDPNTGSLVWRVTPGHRIAAGQPAGGLMVSTGYMQVKVEGRTYTHHRLAWLIMTGVWPRGCVDHVNGARADNRWLNLRCASHSVNMQNQRWARADSRSGFLGVGVDGRKFRARLKVAGVRHDLGSFETAEAAHEAYVAAKRRLHEGCTI